MTKCIVYGLYSSRDDELRYIGQTTQSIARRLIQHRSYARRQQTAVHKWFIREVHEGFDISIKELACNAVMHVTEQALIAEHKASGARLLNLTDGGEGTIGWRGNKGNKRPDLAERNRLGKGKPNGRPLTPENKAKLIAANKTRDTTYLVVRNKTNHPWIGKKHTPDWFEKVRGVKRSPEQVARIRAGVRAYWDAKRTTPSA